jgi:hypothetical protein
MGIHVANSSYGPFDRDWGLEHFVWTPRDWEGIKQSGIKKKLSSIYRMIDLKKILEEEGEVRKFGGVAPGRVLY